MSRKKVTYLNGYRLLYEPSHPRKLNGSGFEGYVYEHIKVAEKFFKRKLIHNEVVHHLDGNRSNNRKENLLILERSQHSKLHIWLKNLKTGKKTEIKWCTCGNALQLKQKLYCSRECFVKGSRKVEWPSKKQLQEDINSMSFLAIGKKYGVSDNAIRKWAKNYGIIY